MTIELKEVLKSNNLAEYIGLFEQHKILDLDTLSEINGEELEKIGITALGDRKKILRLFGSQNISRTEPAATDRLAEVVVHHAAQSGDDVQTGFGKGFGETVGKKAGGCAWSIGVIVIIVIVIAIVIGTL
jgi:hypothetical protein